MGLVLGLYLGFVLGFDLGLVMDFRGSFSVDDKLNFYLLFYWEYILLVLFRLVFFVYHSVDYNFSDWLL